MELIGYIFALVSAVALAVVVVGDTLMMDGCFIGRPSQPLFISTLLDPLFGIIATMLAFLVFNVPFLLVPWQLHLWAFIAGVFSWLTLWYYFKALGEDGREPTEVAAWIASTPIWILLASAAFAAVGFDFASGRLTAVQWGGIAIVSFALVILPIYVSRWESVGKWRYRRQLLYLVAANSLYTVIFAAAIGIMISQFVPTGINQPELAAVLNLLPAYWIGMATGCSILLRPNEWRRFRDNIATIYSFRYYILLLEVAGMLVFWAEIISLGFIHPAVAALVVGSHPVLVLALGMYFRSRGWADESSFPKVQRPVIASLALLGFAVGFLFVL